MSAGAAAGALGLTNWNGFLLYALLNATTGAALYAIGRSPMDGAGAATLKVLPTPELWFRDISGNVMVFRGRGCV